MYIAPTPEAIAAFSDNPPEGPVAMLNLLRFREGANYIQTPELAPATPISGREAYGLYVAHAMPHLEKAGAQIMFDGAGGPFLIGPEDVTWDRALLVRYPSVEAFMTMVQDPAYQAGIGHRTAALEDSRLLPLSA